MKKLFKIVMIMAMAIVLSSIFVKPKVLLADSGTCLQSSRRICVIGDFAFKEYRVEVKIKK